MTKTEITDIGLDLTTNTLDLFTTCPVCGVETNFTIKKEKIDELYELLKKLKGAKND